MEIEKLLERLFRLMIIISLGVFSISMVYIVTTLKNQNVEKENIRLSYHERVYDKTQDVLIWRRYHDEQKMLLREILYEIKKNQNIQGVQTGRQIQCL